jgi:dihydrofolate reductase
MGRKSYVRLEVGTAHRCNVDWTNQGDKQTFLTYPTRFSHQALMGRKSYVRLEVGTAHRCNLDWTNQGDKQTFLTYPTRFSHPALMGRKSNEHTIFLLDARQSVIKTIAAQSSSRRKDRYAV